MKLEKQLVNLELSTRVKGLKVKQESLWWWCLKLGKTKNKWTVVYKNSDLYYSSKREKLLYSAFTVSELGEILPYADITHTRLKNEHACYYRKQGKTEPFYDLFEANARAKMLIWLIENNKEIT